MTINTDRRALMAGAAAAAATGAFGASAAHAAPADIEAIRKAAVANQPQAIKRLQDWIAVPTIAAIKLNVDQGVNHMMGLARDAGFQQVKRVDTDTMPGVFGVMDNGQKRWVGVYFMYDVKQFEPAEWSSPPLEGRLLDKPGYGKVLMGRGAANQKGPESAFLAALHAFKAAGKKLPVNLVLICEGEEEMASPNFKQLATNAEVMPYLKKCDGVFIPSIAQDRSGGVTVTLGSKGGLELQLIVDGTKSGVGPKADIHSSEKARVDSPIWRLTQALASLTSPDGNTPMLDGYMDNVRPFSARDKELVAIMAKQTSEAGKKQALGVTRWINDETYEQSIERLLSQPTINLQGLVGGYTGPGGKSILPTHAEAKLELRLVPGQSIGDTARKLRAHLDKRGYTDVELKVTGGFDPTESPEDSRIVQAELAAYKAMGVPTQLSPRSPGGWPGAVFTAPPISVPAVQFGVGYGSGAHAPDEFLVIESSDPKVGGYTEATMGYVHLLYAMATLK